MTLAPIFALLHTFGIGIHSSGYIHSYLRFSREREGGKRRVVKRKKMLGVFKNGVIDPPRELHSPGSSTAPATATTTTVTAGAGAPRSKTPDDTLKDFLNSNPKNGFSVQFVDKAMLAHASPQATPYRR